MTPTAVNATPASPNSIGYIGKIPIRNLWLLMLYASELFRELGKRGVEVEKNPDDIPELIAKMLCSAVERRMRRNLSFGYETEDAVLDRVRGRIDLLNTERYRLLELGKIACNYDRLTVNTERNRYVRYALERIGKVVSNHEVARRCKTLATQLRQLGVTGESKSPLRNVNTRFGNHNKYDRPMVAAAKLALNLALPTESSGGQYLSVPDREITWVRKLFEKGIAGFYTSVLPQTDWNIETGKWINWPIGSKTGRIDKILPAMRTDIVVNHQSLGRRIIIDTKFNSLLTTGWHRDETLRSGYLYQIYAYLRSQEATDDPLAAHASGLLLHPAIDEMINESVVIQNHEIRFATVDLAGSADAIRRQLLDVLGTPTPLNL